LGCCINGINLHIECVTAAVTLIGILFAIAADGGRPLLDLRIDAG